jgi:hypothetical protein
VCTSFSIEAGVDGFAGFCGDGVCPFVHYCVFELRHRSSEVMNCSLNFSSRRDGVCIKEFWVTLAAPMLVCSTRKMRCKRSYQYDS